MIVTFKRNIVSIPTIPGKPHPSQKNQPVTESFSFLMDSKKGEVIPIRKTPEFEGIKNEAGQNSFYST